MTPRWKDFKTAREKGSERARDETGDGREGGVASFLEWPRAGGVWVLMLPS